MSSLLSRDGHSVTTLALSDVPVDLTLLSQSNCILLPIPVTDKSGAVYAPLFPGALPVADILDALYPNQLIFAGRVSSELHAAAQNRGLRIHDLACRNEFAIANAVPTAEGALQLAMEQLPITIHQSRILIVGFGRVGQCTARRFHALGAHIHICARNPGQLALAEDMGFHPIPLSQFASMAVPFDLIINTVPSPVLTAAHLTSTGTPLLLELASPPGGFDPSAVHALGLHLIAAPGLPGKVAPLTAARIIKQTLYHALEELNF